jgi:soluble lytic murein transglycosylase-like protein
MGVADPWNAQQNLNGGAKYLAKQLKGFGRVDMALAAYNAGPGAVGHLGAVPDSKKGYVAKILRTWANYEGFTS